ncbi:MAG: dockerin type I domain-containing protein [Halobacteriota archaeon]
MKSKTQIMVVILVTIVGIGIPVLVSANGATPALLIVKDPGADPYIIPEDTDGVPSWGENATLSVNVTNVTGMPEIGEVTVNLSAIGGSAKTYMSLIGNYTDGSTFNYVTNASAGTANWNGSAYVPHYLQVNASDATDPANRTYNTSVSIGLLVMKNGDVNVDGDTTFSDAMYLYKWKAGKPGFDTIYETIADVNGDGNTTFSDAMYLYKWKAGKPGFDVLR